MGENDCLADSLLQLLIFHGIVADDVDRKAACLANRVRLEAQEDLVPRDVDGCLDFGGFLQHHRHARPTVEFFCERFGCSEDVLPVAGFRLVVHARSDDDAHPADEMVICEGCGRRAGPCLVCHLFSWTAELHEGYHYDPLLPDPLVVDLVAMGGAGGDSGAASSKSHRVLRREKAMGGDEDLAALEALGRRAAVSAGGVGDAGAVAGEEYAGGAEGCSTSTRASRRNVAVGADLGVAPLAAGRATEGGCGGAVEELRRRVLRLSVADLPDPSSADLRAAARVFGSGGVGLSQQAAPGAQGDAGDEGGGPGFRSGPEWKQYTPDVVDETRCLARTWGEGHGAQCTRPPALGNRLCKMHVKQVGGKGWHGEVDGPIPDAKLAEFRRRGKRRALASPAQGRSAVEVASGDGRAAATADVDMLARTSGSGGGVASEGVPQVGSSGRGLGRLVGAGFTAAAPGHTAVGSESLGAQVRTRGKGTGKGRGQRGRGMVSSSLVAAEPVARSVCASAAATPVAGTSQAARGVSGLGGATGGRPTMAGADAGGEWGPRIVTGFGPERVDDVAADERRRVAEGVRRGVARRDEGTQGRMTSFGGEDLDRGAGGPWQARRR